MSSHTSLSGGAMGRRTFLKGAAGVAGLTAASSPAAASSGADLSSWFENTSNYDGVVDETGSSEVTIEVGAKGNNGAFAFGPAAVRVDPGTKVVWKWTGKGGSHNVVAKDGSFESEMVGEQGHTFSQTFESKGVTKYVCSPHETMGMKGAVVVGDVSVGGSGSSGDDSGGSGGSSEELGDWFENVSNYDGVVDKTGKSEVTVEVGTKGNNGAFAFSPAAVRVDPGTTVVWEWTGKGGSHNVVAKDGSFESEMVGEQGHTFEYTAESEGVYKYSCKPHETMGMKGAVVVGDEAASAAESVESAGSGSGGSSLGDTLTLGFAGAVLVGLFGLPLAEMRKQSE